MSLGLSTTAENYLANYDTSDVIIGTNPNLTSSIQEIDLKNGLLNSPAVSVSMGGDYSGDLRQQFSDLAIPSNSQLGHFAQSESHSLQDVNKIMQTIVSNSISLTTSTLVNTVPNVPSPVSVNVLGNGGNMKPDSSRYEIVDVVEVPTLDLSSKNIGKQVSGQGQAIKGLKDQQIWMQIPVKVFKEPTTTTTSPANYVLALTVEDQDKDSSTTQNVGTSNPLDTTIQINNLPEPQRSSTPKLMDEMSILNDTVVAGNIELEKKSEDTEDSQITSVPHVTITTDNTDGGDKKTEDSTRNLEKEVRVDSTKNFEKEVHVDYTRKLEKEVCVDKKRESTRQKIREVEQPGRKEVGNKMKQFK